MAFHPSCKDRVLVFAPLRADKYAKTSALKFSIFIVLRLWDFAYTIIRCFRNWQLICQRKLFIVLDSFSLLAMWEYTIRYVMVALAAFAANSPRHLLPSRSLKKTFCLTGVTPDSWYWSTHHGLLVLPNTATRGTATFCSDCTIKRWLSFHLSLNSLMCLLNAPMKKILLTWHCTSAPDEPQRPTSDNREIVGWHQTGLGQVQRMPLPWGRHVWCGLCGDKNPWGYERVALRLVLLYHGHVCSAFASVTKPLRLWIDSRR